MTLTQIKDMTVGSFKDRKVRRDLYHKLEQLVQDLLLHEITCELWIDGSFVTDDNSPADIDIAIRVMDDVMAGLTPKQDQFLTSIAADDEAYTPGLDTFVFTGYSRGHEWYNSDVDQNAPHLISWGHQFGKGRDDWLKGIIVLPLRENTVGLRIRT